MICFKGRMKENKRVRKVVLCKNKLCEKMMQMQEFLLSRILTQRWDGIPTIFFSHVSLVFLIFTLPKEVDPHTIQGGPLFWKGKSWKMREHEEHEGVTNWGDPFCYTTQNDWRGAKLFTSITYCCSTLKDLKVFTIQLSNEDNYNVYFEIFDWPLSFIPLGMVSTK